MSLLDLVVPSKKVVINQACEEKPEVSFEVFGLTTEDFIYLVESHRDLLTSYFIRNVKEEADAVRNSKEIMISFPRFGADIVACGCKEREAAEYVISLPLLTQIELLSVVLQLTMPDGLKKSIEKIGPTILQLLRK